MDSLQRGEFLSLYETLTVEQHFVFRDNLNSLHHEAFCKIRYLSVQKGRFRFILVSSDLESITPFPPILEGGVEGHGPSSFNRHYHGRSFRNRS